MRNYFILLVTMVVLFNFEKLYSQQQKALIYGITGQDGSYLAELLVEKGYEVHGVVRRASLIKTDRIDHLRNKIILHFGDLTDSTNIVHLINEIKPDEIYNLGAQSHVKVSFETPEYTAHSDALGALKILEAIRILGLAKKVKYYQASTSEMFGKVEETPQKETTRFHPRSPYGVAKLYAHWITKNYREAYGIFACSGILFNHESPRRGETFLTRKVTMAVTNIVKGKQNCIYLGNLDSQRDWGYAKEYVEAMWLMMQQDKADDYVIATGETHSGKEFVQEAFKFAGIELEWQGEGIDEVGINKANGKIIVKISKEFFRPAEVDFLMGDASKAQKELGWSAQVTFKELIKIMMESELAKG